MALNARWAELYANGCEYFIILPPWCAYVTVNGTASLFHWSCPCVYLVIYLFICVRALCGLQYVHLYTHTVV